MFCVSELLNLNVSGPTWVSSLVAVYLYFCMYGKSVVMWSKYEENTICPIHVLRTKVGRKATVL